MTMLDALFRGKDSGPSQNLDLSLANQVGVEPKFSARAKRLSLRVNPKTAVIELVIPNRVRQSSINRFINQNIGWIQHRQHKMPQKIDIIDGAKLFYRGADTQLTIQHHIKRTTQITHQDNNIIILTSRDDPSANLKRWIINEARTEIERLSKIKADSIGKSIAKIDLRDTTSRWGSCSSDARLMFSWRLILAPDYVLDYVVGHEVAHLIHMDHSERFWDLCYSLCDKPDEARAWLKKNSFKLLNIF